MISELEKNIINDYPIIGCKACSLKYGLSINKILWIREKNKLKVNKESLSNIQKNCIRIRKKPLKKTRVNELLFITDFIKESVYLLGFIWGDGYINNSGKNKQIKIECLSEDIDTLKPLLLKTGIWDFYERLRKNKKRKTTTCITTNKILMDFLIEQEYKNKSIVTPNKIFNIIPDELKKYFILGWIDADGCFYWNKKYKLRQFYLSGTYEQDWDVFETTLKNIGVTYKIIRISKKSKYSCIRVTNKLDIMKIGNYIYDDLIPFQRKYDKYNLIIN